MKRRIQVAVALVALLLLVIGWAWWPGPPEPVYRGKTLSAWLDDREPLPQGRGGLTDEAVAAVRAIGPAAVPTLLAWLETADSSIARDATMIGWQWGLRFELPNHRRQRERAYLGFRALGPLARSAFPAIAAIVLDTSDDWQRGDAQNALINSDAETMRRLAVGLKSFDPVRRSRAIHALKCIRIAPDEVCLPALEGLGNDPDPAVRQQAAMAVNFIHSQRTAIAPILTHENPKFRAAAARVIGGFRTHARVHLPDLEAAANDLDPEARAAIAEAIRQVQGQ